MGFKRKRTVDVDGFGTNEYALVSDLESLSGKELRADITVQTMEELNAIDTSVEGFPLYVQVRVKTGASGYTETYEWNGTTWVPATIDTVDFNTNVDEPTHQTGRVHWNKDEETLEVGINNEGVVLQMGRELLTKCCNNSGVDISNGQPVYISGVTVDGCPEIELASSNLYKKSRALGVATQDIDNGDYGEVTKFGIVRDFDSGTLTAGTVYLSATEGELTNSIATGGEFNITIGELMVASATEAMLLVDIDKSDTTVEVTDTNGFPPAVRSNLTLTFVDGTRTFSIISDTGDYYFYQEGIKYEKTGAESVVITDTEGLHAIYYDEEALKTLVNPTDSDVETLILHKCLIAYVYWNASDSQHNYFANELHGISMSPFTHLYNHFTRGAQYLFGLGLADFVVNGDEDAIASAQFSSAMGAIADEDNFIMTSPIASTVGLPVYYLDGADANLRREVNSGFSVLNVGTGRLAYNEWTGTTWQLSEVTERDFVLYHIFAINGVDGSDKVISVMGQEQYTTANNARAGAEIEISNLLYLLPIEEIVPIGTVIFQTSNNYDNGVKAKIVDTADDENYVDWRTTELQTGSAPTDHANLSGLLTTSQDGLFMHVSNAEPLQLPTFTTTERDAFTPQLGMMIANSTTNTTQKYSNGSWSDF